MLKKILAFRPTIYDKYIFKQVLFATLAAILLFTIVWIAPEMLLNTIKDILAGKTTLVNGILYLIMQLPMIFGKAFPVGLFLGTLFTFDKFSKDSELTIFRAIGLSFSRIIAPVVVLSLIVTALCFVTGDILIPYSQNKNLEIEGYNPTIEYMYTKKNEKNQPLLAVIVSRYQGGNLGNVIVLDFSRKVYDDLHGLTHILVSQHGKTYPDHWELNDVTEYTISNDGIFIKIDQKDKYDILKGKDAESAFMLMTYSVKKERQITNANLWKYVKLLKHENLDEDYHYMLNKYYQRFFHPFVCVLLAIMGCLLGFSKPREQRLIGFTIAIGCIFLYYITLPFFDLLAEKNVLPPLVTAATPPIAFLLAIIAFYKSKDL